MMALEQALAQAPLVAILRGITGEEAVAVADALHDAGVRALEVPLNSPDPYRTIGLLAQAVGTRMAVGAGTVLGVEQVERLAAVGCRFCVAPNSDTAVIAASLAHGMEPMPGFATPTEAFAAIAAGARYLKAFPAVDAAARLAALAAVLPAQVRLVAVGGVAPADVARFRAVGVGLFGAGSDLYAPGRAPAEVGERARRWMQALAAGDGARVELVCNPLAAVGESPVATASGEVYWVDPLAPRLLCWRGREWREQALPEPVWSLALLPDGSLAGNGATRLWRLWPAQSRWQPGTEVEVGPGCRLNDMTADPRGGLWSGSMHRGLLCGRGALFHVAEVQGPVRRVADGLGVANGMAFSADARTLYVVDTLARTLLAYPADIEAGRLGEPGVVTDFLGLPGKPDGLALAPDGSLWTAMWGAGEIVQVGPGGALGQRIAVPAPHVGSLVFNAAGEAYVSTARVRLSAEQLARHPGSGGLFRVRPS